ncbi:hypothetical protein [Sporosarcina obsidiansis]|nr:hypothetical protein [Sporosarcina obsidiansis]
MPFRWIKLEPQAYSQILGTLPGLPVKNENVEYIRLGKINYTSRLKRKE